MYSRWLMAALLLLGVWLRFQVGATTGFADDDACITFRYARNLAQGHGFVYNRGEHVLGTTTPLFTLALAGTARLGLPMRESALGLDLLGWAAGGLALAALAATTGLPWAGLFAVLLYTVAPAGTLLADIGGMETPWFVAFVLAALWAWAARRETPAWVFAAFAFLTRPDGALLAPIFLAAQLQRHGRLSWRGPIVALAILTPWLAFATWYFGSPIPHSLIAKKVYFHDHQPQGAWDLWRSFSMGRTRQLLLGAALVGSGFVVARHRSLLPVVGWCALYLAMFLAGGVILHYWYLPPFFVPVGLLAAVGLDELLGLFARWMSPTRKPAREVVRALAALLVAGAIALRGQATLAQGAHEAMDGARLLDMVHGRIGMWLAGNTAADARVYAADIGYVGYYSDRRILDAVGLVSPEAVRWNRLGDPVGVLREMKPGVVVLGMYGSDYRRILSDPWFQGRYREAERIRDPQSSPAQLPDDAPERARGYMPDYRIFLAQEGK